MNYNPLQKDASNTPLTWDNPQTTGQALVSGVGNIQTSGNIDCRNADEVTFFCQAGANAHPVIMRILWNMDTSVGGGFGAPAFDTFVTTAPAAGINTITPFINEWNFAASSRFMIAIPVVAQRIQIAVYSNGAPGAGDTFGVIVFLHQTNPTQN